MKEAIWQSFLIAGGGGGFFSPSFLVQDLLGALSKVELCTKVTLSES